MGKYKRLSMLLVNSMYVSICNLLSVLKKNPTKGNIAYFIMCLYEFIIAMICVKYKEDLIEFTNKGEIKVVLSDGTYNINKIVVDVLLKKHYRNEKIRKNLRDNISFLVNKSNILRHGFNQYDSVINTVLTEFTQDSFKQFINIFLVDYKELYTFLSNSEYIVNLQLELYNSSVLYTKCLEVIDSYMFNNRHCLLGEAK